MQANNLAMNPVAQNSSVPVKPNKFFCRFIKPKKEKASFLQFKYLKMHIGNLMTDMIINQNRNGRCKIPTV